MPVLLRPWRTTDAPALFAARRSTSDLKRQFAGPMFDDVAAAEGYVDRYMTWSDDAWSWAIIVDGTAVGSVRLSDIDRHDDTAWASYWLAAAARGRGLAAGGLATVAGWAFDHGVFRLELGHRVDNPASCRVAARGGFVVEGLERAKLRYGDARYDVERHARLATDPEPDLPPIEVAA